jgi:hypothetical protein
LSRASSTAHAAADVEHALDQQRGVVVHRLLQVAEADGLRIDRRVGEVAEVQEVVAEDRAVQREFEVIGRVPHRLVGAVGAQVAQHRRQVEQAGVGRRGARVQGGFGGQGVAHVTGASTLSQAQRLARAEARRLFGARHRA